MGEKKTTDLLKGDDEMNATVKRPCTIAESIIESCKEIKLMQEDRLPKRSWDDFAEKMRKTIEEDEE